MVANKGLHFWGEYYIGWGGRHIVDCYLTFLSPIKLVVDGGIIFFSTITYSTLT